VATVLTNSKLRETLPASFFERDTVQVARDLLGTLLCRRLEDGTILHGAILEAEAYTHDDPACHAFRGKTSRCEVMFGPGGYAYVYFIYGMYFCLNVVTEEDGIAGAVLIRAVDTPGGNGPGKLCRQWGIDRLQNGVNLMDSQSPVWLAKGTRLANKEVEITTRIGLSVAKEQLWRFTAKGHPGVSSQRQRRVKSNLPAKPDANDASDKKAALKSKTASGETTSKKLKSNTPKKSAKKQS
jgi:DNA-3-methyladenine glycosylase